MATYFSDAMAQPTIGAAGGTWHPTALVSSAYNASYKRPGYSTHARIRKKKMSFYPGSTITTSDTVVLGTFKSSDRLWNLWYVQNGTLTTGAFSLGFYRAAIDHVPVANATYSQAALLGTAYANTVAQTRTDFMTGLGSNGQYRGLAIWQLLDLGTPALSADPMCDYDLVLTPTTNFTAGTATIAFFECDYVSFG